MKRILFVDDEPSLLEGLQRMLRPQRTHWEMSFAGGGEEALRMLEGSLFDVVVTDMRMPGMDGAQLLGIVRDRFPGVVRIILSGYCEMESTLRAVPVTHQFIQKPCDGKKLLAAVERACGLTDSLPDESIRKIVSALGQLPCLPHTAATLLRAFDNPDVSVARIAQIVEHDIAISAKVMQLVNSAFFGRSREVTDLHRAVNYLGVEVLRQLVITAEIFRAFLPASRMEGFSLERIQNHSLLTAAIAARLPVPAADVPATAIAALLHDAGTLVLATQLPAEFERIHLLAAADRLPLHTAEELVLGVSHAEIGSYLLGLLERGL